MKAGISLALRLVAAHLSLLAFLAGAQQGSCGTV
jgi:hypothetical protein